ncbi:hypothetical protein GCM10018790_54140 [Kitasatospora xanthocidica]|nr:hypothetical protein GCM10018790_54140 [Kitasatospora xanthocidica]
MAITKPVASAAIFNPLAVVGGSAGETSVCAGLVSAVVIAGSFGAGDRCAAGERGGERGGDRTARATRSRSGRVDGEARFN